MIPNRISVTLSQADQEAVLKAFEIIKEKMPFLVSLTPDETQAIPRFGSRSQDFVDKALEIAALYPDILPRGFEVEEMRKDIEAYKALTPIRLVAAQLLDILQDTQLLMGSEAYSAALTVYLQTKTAGKGMGLEPAADELAKRFVRNFKGKEGDAPKSETK